MKSEYTIRFGVKSEFDELLKQHHYLSKIENRSYRVGDNIVLLRNEKVVGVAIFTGLPVPELAVGMFGLNRNEQEGLVELSRFCIDPDVQKSEHNISTWFLARAIRLIRKTKKVKAILSYADSKYHSGTIYKAYGFDYYGLTAPKKDWKYFDAKTPLSRGIGESSLGSWVPRSRKHRFLIVYDKELKNRLKWKKVVDNSD